MRKNIVAGNWKMNKSLDQGLELVNDINKEVEKLNNLNADIIIGTPFIHLADANRSIKNDAISIAAQNCAKENNGAFTGEISAEMIKSTNTEYVILGHSERREYYFETSETLSEKVHRCLENNLKIIFCIGESLEVREANKHFNLVKEQLDSVVFKLDDEDFKNIVIAYEPIWAIGTGLTATTEQAQEMHAFIRQQIANNYSNEIAENTSILYGGSCKPSNAKELFSNKDVDGGLIGGASLDADSFIKIVSAF
ncbi:triose-phosphate isomerase [Marinilabiliaceae bacterium JC040]|nr:triose-phosphate isomerase [Marinilabiliaceae bacterium JC040]